MKYIQDRSRIAQANIIKAARELMVSSGFEATTTEEIAAKAGVSKASIFAHFGDKTNLLIAVGIERMTQMNANLDAKSVFEFYQPWFEFMVQFPDFSHLYFNHSNLPEGAWSKQFNQSCDAQENAVAAIISRMGPAKLNAPHPAIFYARGAQAFFYQTVLYRNAGWLESDKAALSALRDSLDVWLSD